MKEGLNLKYLANFYKYLYAEKGKNLAVFVLITFVTSLLPYFIVAINIDYNNNSQVKSFYGDGSILTLCTGILLSYYTVFLDFKRKKLRDFDNADNTLITVSLLIIYAIVLLQFYLCQTTNDRSFSMIIEVIFGSLILIILTIAISTYLHFKEVITYSDVHNYFEQKERNRLTKASKNSYKTDDNIKL